jgi:alkylation response protein AidB-like acyl-CoA dehydrogenase
VDFTPTETQTAVRDVICDVLDRGTAGWKALADANLLGVPVPSAYGGEGLGLLEVGTMLHEAGRRAVGLPILETLACAVPTVVRCGTEEQKARILPDVVSGRSVLTVAANEPGAVLPRQPHTALRREGERWLLSGRKVGVSHLDEARLVLVSASRETGEAAVVLVDPSSPGVSVLPGRASRGDGAESTLVLDEVEVAEADVLGGVSGEARSDVSGDGAAVTLRRHCVAGLCLFGDGLVAGARDLTADHVKQRRQFGRALAEFQAVSGQMADVYVASRTIGLASLSAAWRLATAEEHRFDADQDLAVAAYWFTAEAPPALQTCHHLHGGMGVDVTYPLHAYFSWVKDLTRALGGPHQTLDAVAAVRGLGRS